MQNLKFAMFLSQVLNNRSAATAIMVIGLFLSMINVPEAFGLLSKVWSYLPGAYIGSWTFTEYRLIHIFGKFFNNLQMAPFLDDCFNDIYSDCWMFL